MFKTKIIKKHPYCPARVTRITTAHGEITTPAFMTVGTRAFVNCMTPTDLKNAGAQIILGGNTYHMLCAPGVEIIQAAGGMHQFMAWDGPMLTDSGGFQVFSLSKRGTLCKIDEHGASFRHPTSGKSLRMTPTSSLETQKIIGADIIMAFDQCTPDTEDKTLVEQAMQRTHRWLLESKHYHDQHPNSVYGYYQALFGIVQGAYFKDLREESTDYLLSLEVDGIAIGGESIGFDMQKSAEIVDWVRPRLPENKTRYTMGVGLYPQDLIDIVERGIDIFDCVAPTRNARHGTLYAGHVVPKDHWLTFASDEEKGRILIKKNQYAKDERPILEGCGCTTCQQYSRAYLHYLFKEKTHFYNNLACTHNIFVMNKVCEVMQQHIYAVISREDRESSLK